MKKEWITILVLSIIIILLLPWTVNRWVKKETMNEDLTIRVKMPSGQIETLPLEEYLVGVVAEEMPAEFNQEALKAQAVAARTYAAKRISQKSSPDPGYDVDTTVLTQAWLSDSQMKTKWGWWGYWRYRGKMADAVQGTKGQVLVANGQYIDAFYHSSSGRKTTERAEDVWSTSRTYLQNVDSEEKILHGLLKLMTLLSAYSIRNLESQGPPKSWAARILQLPIKRQRGELKVCAFLVKLILRFKFEHF